MASGVYISTKHENDIDCVNIILQIFFFSCYVFQYSVVRILISRTLIKYNLNT